MKIMVWMFISFDRHSTSGHLFKAITKALCEQGNSVHIIQKKTGGDLPLLPKELEELNVTTEYVEFKAPNKSNFAARYVAEMRYVQKSKKLIKEKYDAYFIQSNITAGFSVNAIRQKDKNAYIVYNIQDVYPQNVFYAGKVRAHNIAYICMKYVQKYAYKKSDRLITISEDMKDLILEEGIDTEKIDVIYNWSYKDDLYDKSQIAPEISKMFCDSFFNVVYAGNIGLFQNVGVVVDAAYILKDKKDIWFHIFGEGMYKDNLKKKAEELEISNITFHPIQRHDLAPSVYSCADVNLIPLAENQYRTALPSKTATCLACQKPIIFSIGSNSKFGKAVSQETGCPIVDCNEAEELARVIELIKNDQIKCDTKKFYLENCSITRNSRAYATIITRKKYL